jgi:hypothetical protein
VHTGWNILSKHTDPMCMQVAKFCSTLTGNHTGARVRQKKNHTGAEVFLFLSKLGRLEMKSREKKIRTKKKENK